MTYNEAIKREVKVDNSAFRDRFRFLFSANDNIVCERFFKINYFNNASVFSEELGDTIRNIVGRIQADMESKSRIHTWYTDPSPVKLTGFKPDGMGFAEEGGTYLVYDTPNTPKEIEEEVKPYDVTFKFDFQMAQNVEMNQEDGKPSFSNYKSLYCVIWDGTVYPKDVRNSVDLSNSMSSYRNCDVSAMNFIRTLNYRMILGKSDLIYETIKRICDTTSGEGKTYTNSSLYGTGNIVSGKELVGLERYGNRYYTIYKREEGSFTSNKYDCPVYRTMDGRVVAERPDGMYSELVEYTHEPYAQYVKSWESSVRKKTDEYRRGYGNRQTGRKKTGR